MALASDPRLLTLHALKLKGFAEETALAGATGLDRVTVDQTLDTLEREGLVRRRTGRVSGWSLTADGRTEHSKLVAAELEASGRREVIRAGYRGFMEINAELLDTCTAWQLIERDGTRVHNDHTDADHDRAVLDRLHKVHEAVGPICDCLSEGLERFRVYGPRLDNAIDRVKLGQLDWFTRPVIDSYHTVWFELHEDLLVTLGVERSREHAV